MVLEMVQVLNAPRKFVLIQDWDWDFEASYEFLKLEI